MAILESSMAHTPNAKVLQVLREAHGPHQANHFDGAEDADHAHDLLGKPWGKTWVFFISLIWVFHGYYHKNI